MKKSWVREGGICVRGHRNKKRPRVTENRNARLNRKEVYNERLIPLGKENLRHKRCN